jgi:transposase
VIVFKSWQWDDEGSGRHEGLWTPTAELPLGASHPFYARLNQILDEKKFDEYVETICEQFYADDVGRPGLIYFRLLMVGYFEGIDSERGIAWRASDSLSIRSFVRIALDESVPDHSTISRTSKMSGDFVSADSAPRIRVRPTEGLG